MHHKYLFWKPSSPTPKIAIECVITSLISFLSVLSLFFSPLIFKKALQNWENCFLLYLAQSNGELTKKKWNLNKIRWVYRIWPQEWHTKSLFSTPPWKMAEESLSASKISVLHKFRFLFFFFLQKSSLIKMFRTKFSKKNVLFIFFNRTYRASAAECRKRSFCSCAPIPKIV